MAWHKDTASPAQMVTLSGAYAVLMRAALRKLLNILHFDDPCLRASRFVNLEYPERVVALHDVATALLNRHVRQPHRQAYHDAAVAALFGIIRQGVAFEIDELQPSDPRARKWRHMVWDAYLSDKRGRRPRMPDEGHSDWEAIINGMLNGLIGERRLEECEVEDLDQPPEAESDQRRKHEIGTEFLMAKPDPVTGSDARRLFEEIQSLAWPQTVARCISN